MLNFFKKLFKIIEKNQKIIYLTLIFLMSLTPLLWFIGKNGFLINGVDINFPLDPLIWIKRRLYVWNNTSNVGSDYSYAPAGLFFHTIQLIPYLFGFSLQVVQRISFVFWFSLLVFSSYIFSKTIFPKKYYIQLVFVNLYCFNIFLFNTWENIKVANLSLVAAIPLIFAIFIKLRKKEINYKKASIYLFFSGLVLSGSGINPAYFICFFLCFIILFFSYIVSKNKNESVWNIVKDFLFVTTIILLTNSFWIFPTTRYVFEEISLQGDIAKIGFTNWLESLSENTSLINVIRMQGAWDWYAFDETTGAPLYIPYAVNYFYRTPFLVFSFLLPVLAFLSFTLRGKENKTSYVYFGLLLAVGVFLGAGIHPPSGEVFSWLIRNIPLFSLFRSPWYIFTPMVVLSTAGLVSLFFYSLDKKVKKENSFLKKLVVLSSIVIVIGNLLYSYPLVTGKIFRPTRSDSFYIKFPDYILESKRWLDDANQGRVLIYPEDSLESFNWGYRGVEPVLSLLTDREFIFPGFNTSSSKIISIINQFYDDLKKGKLESVKNIMSKLKTTYILQHNDQQSLPFSLVESLNSWKEKDIGMWSFYKNPYLDGNNAKIFSASNFFFGYPYEKTHKLLSVLDDQQHLLNSADDVVLEIPNTSKFVGSAIVATNSQEEDYQNFITNQKIKSKHSLSDDFSFIEYTFSVPEDALYLPVLESYGLEDIASKKQLRVTFDGKEDFWSVKTVTDSAVYFEDKFIAKGQHKLVIYLNFETEVLEENFQSVSNFKENTYENKDAFFEIYKDGQEQFLRILNKGKINVSSEFDIPSFDPMSLYYINLDYKSVYGNTGTCLIGQETSQTLIKTQTERLLSYPEWVNYGFYYEPVRSQSKMSIELVAPFINDPFGSLVYFDNLKVSKVFTNSLVFINQKDPILATPDVQINKNSPVEYSGTVESADGPHIIIFAENYSSAWDLLITDNDNNKVDVDSLHFSTDYYSNAWYIENAPSSYNFKIFYKPQKLFNFSILVSLATFIVAILLYKRKK